MPTLNDVLAGSLAQAVQVQQIIDALKGTPNKGVPIALVSLNDSTNYALSVQNDDPTNSRALLVLKADGTTLIQADATGVTLGAPVNLPSGSINGGTAIAAGSITNAQLGPDVARANLLTNPGFEVWQRGTGPFTVNGVYTADRWQISLGSGSAITINRVAGNGSPYGLQASYTHSSLTQVTQKVENVGQLVGRAVTFSVDVQANTANAARVLVWDAVSGLSYSAFHPGDGQWHRLSSTLTVSASATVLQVYMELDANVGVNFDNAMLVLGNQPANYAPLTVADDLARCLRYYEIIGEQTSSMQVSTYVGSAGQVPNWFIRYLVHKAVLPTVTKNGTWAVGNASTQPTVGQIGLDGFALSITSAATGMVSFGNNTAGNTITVEANP